MMVSRYKGYWCIHRLLIKKEGPIIGSSISHFYLSLSKSLAGNGFPSLTFPYFFSIICPAAELFMPSLTAFEMTR